MHRVEIRLTNEGAEPQAFFEVYNETLKDGRYVELAPMRDVASGGTPIVLFLEGDERVVVVAKVDKGRMVYDKEQNANVRIPSEAEQKDREARDAQLAKAQADQDVRSAQARAGEVDETSARDRHNAEVQVRRAEANAKKVQAEQANKASTATQGQAQASAPARVASPSPPPTGNPASANTGPVDSKQVKAEGGASGPTPAKSNG